MGRGQEQAAPAEATAALCGRIGIHLHPAKVAAIDAGNAIVLRQAFVDIGVVAAQQVDHATVFANQIFEEHLTLLPERVSEVFIELGKGNRVGHQGRQVAQV